jgi:hypothetical protein
LTDVTGGGTSFYPHEGSGNGGRRGTAKNKGASGKGKDSEMKAKITVQAKAGRVLFHWHGVSGGGCMLHEGDEVVSGDKWVLRTDVLG